MDVAGIASGSTAFTSAKVMLQANYSVMNSTMDLVEDTMGMLLEGLEAAVTGLGQNIDMMA